MTSQNAPNQPKQTTSHTSINMHTFLVSQGKVYFKHGFLLMSLERIWFTDCRNEYSKTFIARIITSLKRYKFPLLHLKFPQYNSSAVNEMVSELSRALYVVFSYATLLTVSVVNYLCLSACSIQQWNTRGLRKFLIAFVLVKSMTD